MITGLIILLNALVLSCLAGFISIIGMKALFPAGGWIIIALMAALEIGKLVVTIWLHRNWADKSISRFLKSYLLTSVVVLMLISSLGVFGWFSQSHLETESPVAGIELKISQIQQRIDEVKEDRASLDNRQKQLDQQIDTMLSVSKNSKDAVAVNKIRNTQRKERDQLRDDMTAKDTEINQLTDKIAPLKNEIGEVNAKLGPVKYVADLIGWKDADAAVRMIIFMIMLVFDPLAIGMLVASQSSFDRWILRRSARKQEPSTIPSLPVLPAPDTTAADPISDPQATSSNELNASPPWLPPSVTDTETRAEPKAIADPDTTSRDSSKIEIAVIEPKVHGESIAESPVFFTELPDSVVPKGSSILGPVALPIAARITLTSDAGDYATQPIFAASVTTEDVNWLTNTSTFGGYQPLTDREQLIKLLERRSDLLQEVVETVKETYNQSSSDTIQAVPTKSGGVVEPASKSWLNRPWFQE